MFYDDVLMYVYVVNISITALCGNISETPSNRRVMGLSKHAQQDHKNMKNEEHNAFNLNNNCV